jgi:hypothetical protein
MTSLSTSPWPISDTPRIVAGSAFITSSIN